MERLNYLLGSTGLLSCDIPLIHVVGTKGKGSTASFLSNILNESKYSSGMFTSPHLHRITERIKTNLIEISGPVGNINPNPNSGIIEYCDGHTISEVLSVTTASNANPASWDWYHNGSLVQSGGNTYPITLSPPTYTSSGIYNVVLTDVNGCSNSTDNPE